MQPAISPGNAAPRDDFPAVLERLLDGAELSEPGAQELMDQALDGSFGPERLSAFVTALRAKGLSATELVGFARALRRHGHRLPHHVKGPLLDTCGTGGAARKTINLGTAAALVACAAGVAVAKHGTRSVTRPSGSADVIEAAGGRLDLAPRQLGPVLDQVGFAFLFAPTFHPALRVAGPVRQALGIPTVFNLLGPLCNPAGATHQVLGVHDPALLDPMAEALARLGCVQGYVLHGEPGFDEATPCGPVQYVAIERNRPAARRILNPAHVGIARANPEDIAPLPRAEAVTTLKSILSGRLEGPRTDAVALNAAFALCAAGVTGDLREGVETARSILKSGAAMAKLQAYVAATRSLP